MRHIELHILQSVPVSCLNRDDLGSPKSAFFGGVKRARVSSQCWKRAIRLEAAELSPESFNGQRTRLIYDSLKQRLENSGEPDSDIVAQNMANYLVNIDKETKKLNTILYTSPKEIETIINNYIKLEEDKKELIKNNGKDKETIKKKKGKGGKDSSGKGEDILKKIFSSLKNPQWLDAADIALFGRMVANDASLKVEGAAMFSHALSTHRVNAPELDFFTAVDDNSPDDEQGAAMAGTLEFQSATYYRFAAINLDMLEDEQHLGALAEEQRNKILASFIEAIVKAMPSARRNSMNGNTLPGYVLAIIREKGHPVQLVNAFEKPVKPNNGLILPSIKALKSEFESIKNIWGIETKKTFEFFSSKTIKDEYDKLEKTSKDETIENCQTFKDFIDKITENCKKI